MDVVATHWQTADTQLMDMNSRAKALRDDHMLQMKIKGLQRDWKQVETEHINYLTAVRAVYA